MSLPRGWSSVRACDVCDAIPNGSTPKADKMSDLGEVPFVKVYNLTFDGSLDFSKNPTFISQSTHDDFLTRSRSRPGDVLMNIVGPPLGKVSILPSTFPEWNFNQAIVAFQVDGRLIDNRYLANQLLHASAAWASRFSKATVGQHNIAVSDCREMELLLPPLNEQLRIVAKIDALTAKSRRAKEALDAIPPLLDKLRRSILTAAFRGDLTADWRAAHPDVEPATQLLDRIRAERRRRWEEAELAKMKAKGKPPTDDRWKVKYQRPEPVDESGLPQLPEGWCWASVDELTSRLTNGFVGPTRDIYQEAGIPYLLARHVRNNKLSFDHRTYISEEFNNKNHKSILRSGDVLLVQTGHVGESAVVPPEHEGHNCHAMIVITPISPIRGSFLSWYFNSPYARRAFSLIEKGMTLRHLNCGDVVRAVVPVPPEGEQDTMTDRIEQLLSIERRAIEAINKQLARFEELNSAILAKAFRGELVPQDPNDEPASALLERVRTESGVQPKKTGRRRKAKTA